MVFLFGVWLASTDVGRFRIYTGSRCSIRDKTSQDSPHAVQYGFPPLSRIMKLQMPLQHWLSWVQFSPKPLQPLAASALFASPKQASAMPASPSPNFFKAPRRVTDWARLFVSSSNLLFMFFLSFCSSDRFPLHRPSQQHNRK